MEEWRDRVDRMCEALCYNEPRMRFEFVLDGIRNKQLRSLLYASITSTIGEVFTFLLLKGLHRLVAEEEEFAEDRQVKNTEPTIQDKMYQQVQQMDMLLLRQKQQEPPVSCFYTPFSEKTIYKRDVLTSGISTRCTLV